MPRETSYPSFSPELVNGMPLIFTPRMAETIDALTRFGALTVTEAIEAMSEILTAYREDPITIETVEVVPVAEGDWISRIRPSATAWAGVNNPGYANPRALLSGRVVAIRGVRYRVLGVEMYATPLPYREGLHFGLFLEEIT